MSRHEQQDMLPLLNKNLPIPLYHQLKNILLDSIRTAELKPNDRLPTETEIAEQYGVSKATVRQALGQLASEGVLQRVQGRGTFIATPRVNLGPTQLDSFTLQMTARGLRPSSRVIEQRVMLAEGEIAQKLRLKDKSPVLLLRRLRLGDDQPMGTQTAHVPMDLAPGLDTRDFRNLSLYRVLNEIYGLIPARAYETHSAVSLEPEQSSLLETAPGAPALSSERLTLMASGRPMELVYSLMRGDRHQVVLELSASQPIRTLREI